MGTSVICTVHQILLGDERNWGGNVTQTGGGGLMRNTNKILVLKILKERVRLGDIQNG